MASSSRPFQSQTLGRFLATYRSLTQGAAPWLRRGRTALVWGAQVALYPAYVALQSLRTVSRRLQAAQPWQNFSALFTNNRPQPMVLRVDSPIRALLSLVQPQGVRQPGGLRYVDRYGQFLRQSRAESILTNGQWQWLPLPTPVQGVASDLASRQLVLVTADQKIFHSLTADQQDRLQRAIVLLLAEYARVNRQPGLHPPTPPARLPLPRATVNQWPPVRWVNRLLAWMQTSPLAVVTNLFGEAQALSRSCLGPGAIPLPDPREDPTQKLMPRASGAQLGALVDRPGPPVHLAGPPRPPSLSTLAAPPPVTLAAAVGPAQPQSLVEAAPFRSARAATDLGFNPVPPAWPSEDTVDTQAALVHYVDHPLVVVLRWLDGRLYALEGWLKSLWQWLQRHL